MEITLFGSNYDLILSDDDDPDVEIRLGHAPEMPIGDAKTVISYKELKRAVEALRPEEE